MICDVTLYSLMDVSAAFWKMEAAGSSKMAIIRSHGVTYQKAGSLILSTFSSKLKILKVRYDTKC
jgi:hypothetical protein